MGDFVESQGANQGAGSAITVGTLLKRFNVLSVSGCTICALFGFTFKESILEPTCENYFGLSSNETAYVQMIESVMFVGMSCVVSIIPDKKKNFNKVVCLGALLFTISMFCEGPFKFLPVTRATGIYWLGLGIGIGGIGGAMIMPAAMPALDESLKGVYPPGKDGQVKNAMGALVAGAFGAGNFIGTIMGGVLNTLFETNYCLGQPVSKYPAGL